MVPVVPLNPHNQSPDTLRPLGSHLRRNARLAEGSSQCHWRVACFAEQVNSPKYATDPLIPSGYVKIAIENGHL